MKSRWTFRCYPNPEQAQHLARTFGCVRYVWNWALRLRSDGWRNGQRIGYPETDKLLTALKREPETAWLNEVSSVCLQQALRDLQSAFSNFFDKRAAYPSFKRKEQRQSANYSERGFSFDAATRTLKLAKIGAIKVKWSRSAVPLPSSIRLIRMASGKFFVSLVVETLPAPLPATGEAVGIDFGINRLATLSTGEQVANPKHGAKHQRRLAFLQRQLARKKYKASKRRHKLKRQVARVHEKIANSRTDTLHKFSTNMVRRFDVIYIEDLNLRGMVTNHSLARSLSDASLGVAARMLEEKAERYGKSVERIDRWFPSSKICSGCGHIQERMPLDVRNWTCPSCGTAHDRDVNAAMNILVAGQAVSAHGGTVRRTAAKAAGRKSPRSANQQAATSGSGV
jgi:putative transposase